MVRYYPPSKVITNLTTKVEDREYFLADGNVYSGKYYLTFDGKAFSGPSPEVGPSDPLIPNIIDVVFSQSNIVPSPKPQGIKNTPLQRTPGKPNSYYPQPTDLDYAKGYVIRYFTKKENEKGFITEISQEEYNSIVNGTADYDISIYQTAKILWKLTGPLRSQRKSQYNVIPGIIDTNQRLTEETNKTFLGIIEFIGGEYDKFARPTM